MRTIIATDQFSAQHRFQHWRDAVHEFVMPVSLTRNEQASFEARMEFARIGSVPVTRLDTMPVLCEATSSTFRKTDVSGTLNVTIVLAGQCRVAQGDVASLQAAGDIFILEPRPATLDIGRTKTLVAQVPRERLERVLGPARLYSGLRMGGDLPGVSLARHFFEELVRVHETLSVEMAERMTTIGVDLLVACAAERLAQGTPGPLQGTVTVQRAKAYIEVNLGDPRLDPPQLAAAMGVSLRRLQGLFRVHGLHISDWIWKRRLDVAARRLSDPGNSHLSIGAIAYGCGFNSQAHFSKRFRDRFGLSPNEHRRAGSAFSV